MPICAYERLSVACGLRAECQAQLPVGQDMRAIRERDSSLCTLLDKQDRETAVADGGECLEDQVDHAWSEP